MVGLSAFQATTLQEMNHVIPHSCGFTIMIQEHSQKTKLAPWDDLASTFLLMPATVLITDNLQGLWLAEVEKKISGEEQS